MDQMSWKDDSLQDELLSKQKKESVSSSSRKRKVDKTEPAGSVMPKKKNVSSLKSTPATKTTKAEKPKKENKPKAEEKDELRMRKSIHDVKLSGDRGNKVIAGKVLAKSVLRTYQTKKKEKKFFFNLGVADETGSIKVIVFRREHYQRLQEKRCYLFRDVIMDKNVMKVTEMSTISNIAPIDVPENVEMEAQMLGYSQTPVCTIEQAIGSEEKTSVSVEGKVTEIGKLKKKKGTKNRKEFQLEDGTGSIRITLWGEDIKQLRGKSPGDSVKVVNVKTSHYNDSVSLNSADFTRISKERVVSKQKKKQKSKKKESVSSSSRKRKVDKAEKPKKENKPKAEEKGQKHFVDEHRNELTRRVTNIDPILDDLLQEKIIDDEVYSDVRAHRTSQKQMRELFIHIVKAGDASKEALYQVLTRHQKMLIEDLIQKSTK